MTIDPSKPITLPEAIASFDRRSVVGTRLGSADLRRLPGELRAKAFFSARVESARFLDAAKKELDKSVSQYGVSRDRATFIAKMQTLGIELGLRDQVADEDRGSLRDITSARRLGLIYDIQRGLALGEARWRKGQSEAMLYIAPCQELVRVRESRVPRDWPTIWTEAGGTILTGNRMIARKDSEIWSVISDFDLPYPPFKYGSGMGVKNVRRREAIALGFVGPKERVQPSAMTRFDSALAQASISRMNPETQTRLLESFGDLATRDESVMSLREHAVSDFVSSIGKGPATSIDLGEISPGRRVRLYADAVRRNAGGGKSSPLSPAIDPMEKMPFSSGSYHYIDAREKPVAVPPESELKSLYDQVVRLPDGRKGRVARTNLSSGMVTVEMEEKSSRGFPVMQYAWAKDVSLDSGAESMSRRGALDPADWDELPATLWMPDRKTEVDLGEGLEEVLYESVIGDRRLRARVEYRGAAGRVLEYVVDLFDA